jgi:hypothetical protein
VSRRRGDDFAERPDEPMSGLGQPVAGLDAFHRKVHDADAERRDEVRTWDPLVVAGDRGASAAGHLRGIYERRWRCFWTAVGVARLTYCAAHRPDLDDLLVRAALVYAAVPLQNHGREFTWPLAVEALAQDSARTPPEQAPWLAAELPAAAEAARRIVVWPAPPVPRAPWPLRWDWGYLRDRRRAGRARHTDSERLTVYWSAIWQMVAVWGAGVGTWASPEVRESAREALGVAGLALSGNSGRLVDEAQRRLDGVIGLLR